MRQVIFLDKDGNVCGEFPHDPDIGFLSGKRGLRRRLVLKEEADTLNDAQLQSISMQRYTLAEKQIRDTQFANDAAQRRAAQIRRDITVSEAANEWYKHLIVTNSQRTLSSYKNSVDIYLAGVGDHKLRDFSRSHNISYLDVLAKFISSKSGEPIKPPTQHQHCRQFRVFLKWAYDNELIDKLHNLKKPKVPQKDMDVFSIDQLRTLREWLYDNLQHAATDYERMHATNLIRAFMIGTNLLLRSGAISAMPLSWINQNSGLVKVRDVDERGFKSKGMKWPNKPINDRLAEFLASDLAARNPKEKWFLDRGDGRPWFQDSCNVSRSMSRACQSAGLPKGVKPFHHGMRATMITWLLEDGEPPVKVQQLADHSDLATTMKYYNTRAAQQLSAVNRLPDI